MILATEAPKGTTTEDLLRQHGITPFDNDPRTMSSSLERFLGKKR
jgi:hypothetical protein